MRRILILTAVLLALAAPAMAQGLVAFDEARIPVRDSFSIERLRTTVDISGQHARTKSDLLIKNECGRNAEARFLFPTPKDAAIGDFAMYVGEKRMDGRLLPKEEARRIYDDIVRSKRDPALLEYLDRGVYQTSVFPFNTGESKDISVQYDEVLKKDFGFVRYVYPLNTDRNSSYPVRQLEVRVTIEADQPISTVYSPSHSLKIERINDRKYMATLELENGRSQRDLEIFYAIGGQAIGASLISYMPPAGNEGYFLLFADPTERAAEKAGKEAGKDLVFVIDRSGSMEGEKMEQARDALAFCINGLSEADRFNIVTFSDGPQTYMPGMVAATPEARREAASFAKGIYAQGGTDILSALAEGLKLLPSGGGRVPIVAFLTDGLPTVGETNIDAIWKSIAERNKPGARLFSFGVGYDVNTALLDKLSGENRGATEYVLPGENLERPISNFFTRIRRPALSDPALDFGAVATFDVMPRKLPDLFAGAQVLTAGRYRKGGAADVILRGSLGGNAISYKYRLDFASKTDESRQFVETVWANRRVGWLVDQIRLNGEQKELVNEIVRLSVRYGIITQYTSFLAEEDRVIGFRASKSKGEEMELAEAEEYSNLAGANFMQSFDAAPQSGAGAVFRAKALQSQAAKAEAPAEAKYMDSEGNVQTVSQVQNIQDKTFFQNGGYWRDVLAPPEAKTTVVRYFSDEFFSLMEQFPTLGQYVANGEPTIVQWNGVAYQFEPDNS